MTPEARALRCGAAYLHAALHHFEGLRGVAGQDLFVSLGGEEALSDPRLSFRPTIGLGPVSWTREVTIWCDGEGCAPKWEQLAEANVEEARARLTREGWTRDGGKDYCPACSRVRATADGKAPRRAP